MAFITASASIDTNMAIDKAAKGRESDAGEVHSESFPDEISRSSPNHRKRMYYRHGILCGENSAGRW
jgi:hypothetical protein